MLNCLVDVKVDQSQRADEASSVVNGEREFLKDNVEAMREPDSISEVVAMLLCIPMFHLVTSGFIIIIDSIF